ncbi:MAG: hypothetical protein ACREBN_01460 [Burkholderiaceae bacterium]
MSETMTVGSLIDLTSTDVDTALTELAKDEPDVSHALGHLGSFAASVGAEKLNKALENDVIELLAKAWTKVQAVRDAAVRSRSTPGQSTLVALGAHDFTHTCEPVLTLYVADVGLPELKLTVEFVAHFNGVSLSIVDGVLRAAAPGGASVIARLKYKSVKLKEKSSPEWKLPTEISFGSGIPIA